jgi:putative hydrolase of the HAD superfamily
MATAMERARIENHESHDCRFKPMAGRLARIFDLQFPEQAALADSLCECFLGPIFALGHVYDDVQPALEALRAAGYTTGIVSNAPWGSPPGLWHRELGRLGLANRVDTVVMCGDVGWRKPARAIFEHAANALGAAAADCVFVGDDLDWDVAGSRAAGMRPVLIDRNGQRPGYDGLRIDTLADLVERLRV